MVRISELEKRPLGQLLRDYPFLAGFFRENGFDLTGREEALLEDLIESDNEDSLFSAEALIQRVGEYLNQMLVFLGEDREVRSVTILPGRDKAGQDEAFENLTIRPGEIISIVGPTGSGKSRLLADIEWMAQGDTPTGRRILINDEVPDPKKRFSSADKLVAQLSQNMNFVMDLTVEEFLALHAESRMVPEAEQVVKRIIEQANQLAGESFAPQTAITALSGGQSRALMIADTAILSRSPIILIDEIENAGIDRQRALGLLLAENKIVLLATHDPVLALMADRRLVIKNGGIRQVIPTTPAERETLGRLKELDRELLYYRGKLRTGERLEEKNFNKLEAGDA